MPSNLVFLSPSNCELQHPTLTAAAETSLSSFFVYIEQEQGLAPIGGYSNSIELANSPIGFLPSQVLIFGLVLSFEQLEPEMPEPRPEHAPFPVMLCCLPDRGDLLPV